MIRTYGPHIPLYCHMQLNILLIAFFVVQSVISPILRNSIKILVGEALKRFIISMNNPVILTYFTSCMSGGLKISKIGLTTF